MTSLKRIGFCLVLAMASAVGASSTSLGAAGGAPVAVVVSSKLSVDDISLGDLKRLYKGSPVMAGGKSLVPLTYPKSSRERQRFDEAVLGMSPDQVSLYWIDRKIRGQAGAPKAIDSEAVLVKVVSKVDGTIGFVGPGAVIPGVKVLRVDGKRPEEPGYPLRI